MKALVFVGPKKLEFRDEPDPQANDDVVVRVDACGICGSDMHVYLGHNLTQAPPLILGHEAAGVATNGSLAGRRVAINPIVTCGACDPCRGGRSHLCRAREIISRQPRPGGFAEFVRVPERNLVAIADGLPMEIAALAEPIAVGYHAVNLGERALHLPISAARVVVIGGGAIGLGAAQVLESRGARAIVLVEANAARRAVIAQNRHFRIHDPAANQMLDADAFDLVIDAYGGANSRADASRLVAPGGVIVHVGLASGEGGLDVRKITTQEVKVIGSFAYTHVEFKEVVAGLSDGRFGRFDWIEERPLSAGATAFADLAAGKVAAPKIVLRN